MGSVREESALNMFRQMDLKGKSRDDTLLKTTHQNTISTIRAYEENGDVVRKFSSKFSHAVRILDSAKTISASGVDGRVVIWTA